MKYTVIYEISYKISPDEWVRVGLNVDYDAKAMDVDLGFIKVQERVESWLEKVVSEVE